MLDRTKSQSSEETRCVLWGMLFGMLCGAAFFGNPALGMLFGMIFGLARTRQRPQREI
jgi:uncharacterized membrane protein